MLDEYALYLWGKVNHEQSVTDQIIEYAQIIEEDFGKPFLGLDLDEMDQIIDSNMTITDRRLRDGIYAILIDAITLMMEKNTDERV